MCRLLAYAAPRETTVREVVGGVVCNAFQHMTRVHDDGWGTAWVAGGDGGPGEVESLRISTSGLDDPLLTTVMQDDPAPARLVHLRLATGMFKRTKLNTHPFLADGIAFAHNGTAVPVERFDGLLEERFRAGVQGDTDSERYFALVRQEAQRAGDLVAGVLAAVRALRGQFPSGSFNALLLTARELLVVHASSTASVTVQTFTELGIREEELPIDHTDDYYRLAMRRLADGTTVFSSTGIDREGWTEVPDDTVSRVDLRTLEFSQVQIWPEGAEGDRHAIAALGTRSTAAPGR